MRGLRAPELLDSVSGGFAAASQRLFAGRAEYECATWEEAAAELSLRFCGGADEVFGEPALARAEAGARRVLAGISGRQAASRRWAADSLLARCAYLACRLAKPEVVVETGVAYGVSSAFILAAMEENGRGRLYSVDLPPLRRASRTLHGAAVPEGLRDRWTLRRGSSRRVLPDLLRDLGEIDLFLHDSLHTRRNMLFEFDGAWLALRPGGVLLADDVERNGAFGELRSKEPSLWRVVKDRETRPLHGRKAPVTFGLAVK